MATEIQALSGPGPREIESYANQSLRKISAVLADPKADTSLIIQGMDIWSHLVQQRRAVLRTEQSLPASASPVEDVVSLSPLALQALEKR